MQVANHQERRKMSAELAAKIGDAVCVLAYFAGIVGVVFAGGWIMAKLDEADERRRRKGGEE